MNIALLLPLSGDYQTAGKALLNAAKLALSDSGNTRLTLLPFDTEGTEAGTRKAAKEAFGSNIKLIVGPLLGKNARAIAEEVIAHGINMIAFSNDKSLADEGIFVLGFTPEQQVKRVVSYAHTQGIREFSSLAPESNSGKESVYELAWALSQHGLPIKHSEFYRRADANLSKIIRRLKDDVHSTKHYEEALFLPDGGPMLVIVATRINRQSDPTPRYRILGTGQWDDPLMAKEPKLIGSWFATSPLAPRKAFEKRYKELYGESPIRIASLAHDGMTMALSMAEKKDFSRRAITTKTGFSGVNGAFHFRDGDIATRSLAIIEITPEGFKEVDPAK